MNDETISIIGKVLAAIFVSLMAYLTPKAKAWFEAHTSKSEKEKIKILIDSFVQAAEQLLHDEDPDGTMRMDYVKNQLTALGISITADVVSMIEGSVWEVNSTNKIVQTKKAVKNE